MTNADVSFADAAVLAAEFNRERGGKFLQVTERPPVLISLDQLRERARTFPGEYIAANLFSAIVGRVPSRSEAVRLGHMLGNLRVARRKSGPFTLWLLDKAFADRAN